MTEDKKQEEMNDVYDIIVINDEEGEHEYVHLETLELDGNTYYVLLPVEETDEDEEEAIILKFARDENGEEMLMSIEDDEEWERVADAWEEMDEDEEDDED